MYKAGDLAEPGGKTLSRCARPPTFSLHNSPWNPYSGSCDTGVVFGNASKAYSFISKRLANPSVPPRVVVLKSAQSATGRPDRCEFRGCLPASGCIARQPGGFPATRSGEIDRPQFELATLGPRCVMMMTLGAASGLVAAGGRSSS